MASLLAAILWAGCGSSTEGPVTGAARFNGYWRIDSASYPMPGGMMTMTRTTTPMSLRGDYTFTATDATHARLRGRLATLEEDGIDHLSPMDGSVTIEGDDWIIVDGSSTTVYTGALAGDALTLTFDAADPRNVPPADPPQVLVLRRMEAQPSISVGTWRMVSMNLATFVVPGDTCFAVGKGGLWAKVHLVFEVDARHLMERTATATPYSDVGCTQASDAPEILRADGFIEESEAGLEVWARDDDDDPLHTRWTFTRVATGRYRLTRTHPLDPGGMPSELVVEKVD